MIHWAYVDHTPFVISERSLLKEQMSCYGYSLILPGGLPESDVIQEMKEHDIALKNCYLDQSSRVETKHDAFQEMLDRLSPDDTVFLPSLNCVAASIGEALESIRVIEEKQALVVIGDLPLYSAALNNVIEQNRLKLSLLLGYVLETERKLRKNKQRQGIEDAGVRGQLFGRPLASRPKDFVPCVIAYERGEITSSEARKRLGVSETTFFNWLKAYRERM